MMNGEIGHGHVFKRPDGAKARCGGPAMCKVCQAEQRLLERFSVLKNDPSQPKPTIVQEDSASQRIAELQAENARLAALVVETNKGYQAGAGVAARIRAAMTEDQHTPGVDIPAGLFGKSMAALCIQLQSELRASAEFPKPFIPTGKPGAQEGW